ncbi:uncharacterized protein LOC115700152 [Cannabis sativa]|uniref:uncharacterized protein LOC115700152 n=1 Tax=Cannabis sativa TaxID=3483 RepID=UPI0029CA9E36|nr:uncharacterized protein LOC115700152 [Cannabis sativa]
MDNGNDDDFEYGPWMKGSKLPTTGYDKYRNDFAKGNAWPLLTRLTRQSLSSTIPTLNNRQQPQPKILFHGESSTSTPNLSRHAHNTSASFHQYSRPTHTLPQSSSSIPSNTHLPSTTTAPQDSSLNICTTTSLTLPLPSSSTPPHYHLSSITSAASNMIISDQFTSPTISPHARSLPSLSSNPITTANLSHIFTPDIGSSHTPHIPYATYPPITLSTIPMNLSPMHATSTITPPLITTSQPHISTTSTSPYPSKENIHPNRMFKRQTDAPTMRQMLKRCRNQNNNVVPSFSSIGNCSHQIVSSTSKDSDGDSDDSAEIALKSRKAL